MQPQPPPAPAARPREDVRDLLARMRAGDREAAARFMARFGPRMHRRIRNRLGPVVQRQHDVEDILSTVSRRLDNYVSRGQLRAKSESEFWQLLNSTADNAIAEKARTIHAKAVAEVQHAAARSPLELPNPFPLREPPDLDSLFESLTDADLELVRLRAQDRRLIDIAQTIGLSPEATRKRWQRVLRHLRLRLLHALRDG